MCSQIEVHYHIQQASQGNLITQRKSGLICPRSNAKLMAELDVDDLKYQYESTPTRKGPAQINIDMEIKKSPPS